MKFLFNVFIPIKGYSAMCVGNVVFVRKGVRVTGTLIQHEHIHALQWKECLYVFFLPLYILSFLWQFIKYWNWSKAYRNVCFEREAYAHQSEDGYINSRKRFAWVGR